MITIDKKQTLDVLDEMIGLNHKIRANTFYNIGSILNICRSVINNDGKLSYVSNNSIDEVTSDLATALKLLKLDCDPTLARVIDKHKMAIENDRNVSFTWQELHSWLVKIRVEAYLVNGILYAEACAVNAIDIYLGGNYSGMSLLNFIQQVCSTGEEGRVPYRPKNRQGKRLDYRYNEPDADTVSNKSRHRKQKMPKLKYRMGVR